MRVRWRNLITRSRPAENADVMAKSLRRSANFARPEWAKTIVRLRKHLGFPQATFGYTFHCSAMAVSRWERGISEPPSHIYIEMGNTAGDPLCWYFWGRAGLSKEDLLRVTPRLQEHLRKAQIPRLEIVSAGGSAKKPEDKKLQLVAIPLLRTVAASHGETGDDHALLQDAPVESIIAAPKDWCPNPSTTSCLRVRGSSMSPLISDGYILVVRTKILHAPVPTIAASGFLSNELQFGTLFAPVGIALSKGPQGRNMPRAPQDEKLADRACSKYPQSQRNRPMRRRTHRKTVAATRIANTTSRNRSCDPRRSLMIRL